MRTYINQSTKHQHDQQPVIVEGHDGCYLDTHYEVARTVAFADFRESYESWLARVRWLAGQQREGKR